MYTRVVRFTDVSPERVEELLARMDESEAPPDVKASGFQMLLDEQHRTAVVLQHFDTLEDMREGDRVFGAMDSADTPGTRASVDMCELKREISLA